MDVRVENHGSIILVRPLTSDAKQWLRYNLAEDAQWFSGAVSVEPRYVRDLILGMHDDCFTVPEEYL